MAGVLSTGVVFAQEPTPTPMGTPEPVMEADPGMACCGMMMSGAGAHRGEVVEWHRKMLEKLKAQDAELDRLVQNMNAASGDKKVDAIAAIINKGMEQRKAWISEMEMRHKKMQDWMQKGQNGMKSGTTPAVR